MWPLLVILGAAALYSRSQASAAIPPTQSPTPATPAPAVATTASVVGSTAGASCAANEGFATVGTPATPVWNNKTGAGPSTLMPHPNPRHSVYCGPTVGACVPAAAHPTSQVYPFLTQNLHQNTPGGKRVAPYERGAICTGSKNITACSYLNCAGEFKITSPVAACSGAGGSGGGGGGGLPPGQGLHTKGGGVPRGGYSPL